MLNDTTNVMTELAPKGPRFVEIIEMMHWPNIPFHKNRKVKFPVLQTIMVKINCYLTQFWSKSSYWHNAFERHHHQLCQPNKHTVILIAAIGHITYKSSLISPYSLLSYFFLPVIPWNKQQCWATQISIYVNLTFPEPNIGWGGRGGVSVFFCLLLSKWMLLKIFNLLWKLKMSRIVASNFFQDREDIGKLFMWLHMF